MYPVQEPDLARGLNVFLWFDLTFQKSITLNVTITSWMVSAVVSGICLCVLKKSIKKIKISIILLVEHCNLGE